MNLVILSVTFTAWYSGEPSRRSTEECLVVIVIFLSGQNKKGFTPKPLIFLFLENDNIQQRNIKKFLNLSN